MTGLMFDHERLDVYRLAIDYVAFSYRIARSLSGVNRQVRDPWLRAAQSIPLNIAEGNGRQRLKDENRFFEIARGSAWECAAIHDMRLAFAAVDEESTRQGKSRLRRIVSMLTRLIQRTDREPDAAIEYEYEYEYRDAEYESDSRVRPEQRREPERRSWPDLPWRVDRRRPVTAGVRPKNGPDPGRVNGYGPVHRGR